MRVKVPDLDAACCPDHAWGVWRWTLHAAYLEVMATNDKPRQLSAVVGEGLRKFRESRGLRQEDIANAARDYGFTWGRSSVAALEAGNRELSIGELLLIPAIVRKLGGWDEPIISARAQVMISDSTWILAHQIPGQAWALLTPTVPPERARQDLQPLEDETFLLGGIEAEDHHGPEFRRKVVLEVSMWERMYYTLWPEKLSTRRWEESESFELDRRVAERITTPDGKSADSGLVEAFSFGLWGRSTGDERDARTDERGKYDTKRALQSARGHVTRELIDELQTEITRRWAEASEFISKTKEAIATDEGLDKWSKELNDLREQWSVANYYKGQETAPRRRRFLRGGK